MKINNHEYHIEADGDAPGPRYCSYSVYMRLVDEDITDFRKIGTIEFKFNDRFPPLKQRYQHDGEEYDYEYDFDMLTVLLQDMSTGLLKEDAENYPVKGVFDNETSTI